VKEFTDGTYDSFGVFLGSSGFGKLKDPAERVALLEILRLLLSEWRQEASVTILSYCNSLSRSEAPLKVTPRSFRDP